MNGDPIRALVIEDNAADAELLRLALARGPLPNVSLEHVERLEDGLRRLEADGVDFVFHDATSGSAGCARSRRLLCCLAMWVAWTLLSLQAVSPPPDFWSFRPLPEDQPAPIDRFVDAALAARGLKPNHPADRRTLIRRATLDLLGLPPSPEDVDRFVADPDPQAYEKLLDRLLAAPQFGERWARHWLDVARYAESFGFEQDYDRPHAYSYRDFVIRAFNADLPYDRFVQWQIAGDELAPGDPLATTATGFLGAGVFPTQLTEREFERARYDELDDMLSTTSTAFLGLSVGCARCHDHKFDPISSADYYRMLATFTTTIRGDVDLDLDPAATAAAAAAFERDHAPLEEALRRFEAERLPSRLAEWEGAREEPPAAGWELLEAASFQSAGGATFAKLEDGSLRLEGANAKFDTYTVTAVTRERGLTAVRVEALADPSMAKGGPGRADNGNFCLTDLKVTAAPAAGGEAVPVRLAAARATFEQKGLPVAHAIDGDARSGWAIDPQFGKDHAAVFDAAEEFGFEGGTTLTFTLVFRCNTGHNIGRLRLSAAAAPRPVALELSGPPPAVARALRTPRAGRAAAENAAVLAWYRTIDPEWKRLRAAADEHLAQRPRPNPARVMICSEGIKPIAHHADDRGYPHFYPQTHVLKRGDPDQKREVAEPGVPSFLARGPDRWFVPPPPGARTSHRRAALARWLTDVEGGAGALLARVIVNRLWQHHLGRGLVATPNDFGAQGLRPTHPELLDALAAGLVRDGWSLKRLHKRIMTSEAYRRGSARAAEAAAADPDNALLWRFEPRRLEGEAIRDSMLAVSGLLDPTMFGPGTLDEGSRRRSIYFTVKRSRLVPMMVAFDLPEPLVSIGRRSATTVAPQALAVMNSPHVRGWAEGFAQRVAGDPDPVRAAYRLAVARDPTPRERRDAEEFLAGRNPRALADFCHVLLGLNEFFFLD